MFHTAGGDIELGPGDKLVLPPHTAHAATVGAEGVRCIEAPRQGDWSPADGIRYVADVLDDLSWSGLSPYRGMSGKSVDLGAQLRETVSNVTKIAHVALENGNV